MPPLGPGFASGMSGGGGDLGKAHGSITLDVSDLLNAERVSKSVGQNIQKNLSGIGTATDAAAVKMGGLGQAIDNTSGRFGGLGRAASSAVADIRALRTEIAAVGAASALITVFGLKASNEIRVARIRLSQFVQTEEEANALMRQLADSAGEFGLEIGGVFALAGTLLPLLEGNVEATAEWVERAARLRAVLPTAQQGAEIRAISEYLSGQSVSLQRLFNIPPNIILEAKAQFTDAGQQIDYILQRMGATEEAARAMSDPLVSIKNELKLIAAVGFDPILQKIREILPEFRVWLQNIRETHPEILQIGGALVTAAAVGAPLLLLATQVLTTFQKIKALGIIAPLGKAGLVGAAVVGGGLLAGEGVRAIGRATGDDRAANLSNLDILRDALKATVDIFLGFMGLLGPAFQEIIRELLSFASMLTTVYTTYGQILSRLGELIPEQFGGRELKTAGNIIQAAGEEAGLFVKNLSEANENVLPEYMRRLTETRDAFGSLIDRLFNVGGSADVPAGPMGGGLLTAGAGTLTELQQSQITAWEEYQEAIIAIESRMQEQRLKITEQYEEQRTRIIAQYEKTIAREAEDFARQRARAAAELANDIQDIRDNQIENEAEWQQELNETIAELREDSIKRIADIEEQANRQREQMERDHRLTLLEAAGRLDARAVANEQRRFKSQMTTFERDLADRIRQERDNLAERIAQEQKAHAKRIAAERKNNEERIAALIEAQAERQALEDEDRAIRLEWMKQDHLAQLAELETANQKRLAELKAQGNKELLELRNQFVKQNLELTDFYDQWLTTQATEQANSLSQWEDFWKSWKDLQDTATGGAGGGTAGGGTGGGTGGTGGGTLPTRRELELIATNQAVLAGWTQGAIFSMMSMIRDWDDKRLALWIEKTFNYDVPGYQRGTMNVPNTGPAILHKGEAVLDATTAGWLRRMFSVNSGPQFAGAGAGSRMNVGGINIYAAPGQSVQDIGREVEKVMTKIYERLS